MVDCFFAENIYVLEGQFIILEPFKRDVYMYIAQWSRIVFFFFLEINFKFLRELQSVCEVAPFLH